ncbi:hypothetical protein MXB_1123 [Myxobolus squamalis]|nr:hypothetical protein MXB_1123 [Myxobolus squamalis]
MPDEFLHLETKFEFLTCWEINTGKCVDASPVIYHDKDCSHIYIGSHSGQFFSIDIQIGRIAWSTKIDSRFIATAVITTTGNFVVIGAHNNNVYCFGREKGFTHWVFPTQGIIKTPAVSLFDDTVLCSSYNGCLYLLEVKSRTLIWKINVDGKIIPSLPVYSISKKIIYVATGGGTVAAISSLGVIIWRIKLESPIFSSLIHFDNSLIVAEVVGTIHLLDDTQGAEINSFFTNEAIYADIILIYTTRRLYISSQEGTIYCLNSSSLEKESLFKIGSRLHSGPALYLDSVDKRSPFLMIFRELPHFYHHQWIDSGLQGKRSFIYRKI